MSSNYPGLGGSLSGNMYGYNPSGALQSGLAKNPYNMPQQQVQFGSGGLGNTSPPPPAQTGGSTGANQDQLAAGMAASGAAAGGKGGAAGGSSGGGILGGIAQIAPILISLLA